MGKMTNKELIGVRIRWARKEAKMNQVELSNRLGFKDRQILANIETGIRKVSADELLVLIDNLGKPLDYFTDPYLIVEENIFSWRAELACEDIDQYEIKARNLIGAFRRFSDLLGKTINPIVPTIPLTAKSSYEQAQLSAEALVERLKLGDIPATRLKDMTEEELGINILFIDMPGGLSGAACHLADLNMILINREDSVGRRNFDLAHEIFHLLTWEKDRMRPDQVDIVFYDDKKKPRIETLADNFAIALLMPEDSLTKRWQATETQEVHTRINDVARIFKVSSLATYYRLKNLGWLKGLGDIDEGLLKWSSDEDAPLLYSRHFVEMLHEVLERGLVSVRKAAALLDMTVDDIEDIFGVYGMKPLYET